MTQASRCLIFALLLTLALGLAARAIPVELIPSADGHWQLLRDGQPYYIMGAGGDGSKEQLAAAGANTIRTWGVDRDLGQLLDRAEQLGLAVIVGHWLGHPRHGFDYRDAAMLKEQTERVRHDVLAWKDHPAVLIWGIGNETEGIGEGDDPAIWSHIQDLAAMIKEIDPRHPTMVVTADIGGQRVQSVHELCPDIDIMGINTYGGLPSLPERYRALGGSKPYLVTEFGPPGVWETGRNGFGVPLELTSTQKASLYKDFFRQGCLSATDLCLGGLAFYWGAKPEATVTWFGMLLPNGDKLAAVDAMTEIWSGVPPANLCPEIISLKLNGSDILAAGETAEAVLEARDPEDAGLSVTWAVYPEAPEYLTFGEIWWQPLELGGIIVHSSATRAKLLMPGGGKYRLYAVVSDGAGGAATANIPFLVEGESSISRLQLPVAVYADSAPEPWAPSGWMGDYQALSMDAASRNLPHSGESCLEFRYPPSSNWVGVAWQNPPQNWGDQPGGYDLSGAERLIFWARSEYGGERVDFGVGLANPEAKYPDTVSAELKNVKLSTRWQRYQISLKGQDLSRVRTPFYWSLVGGRRSTILYLDDIRFE